MASEEFITLKESLEELNATVRENTAEQQKSRIFQAERAAEFSTWQKTMCWPHDNSIKDLAEDSRDRDRQINRAAGRSAGLTAAFLVVLQVLMAVFAYLRIAPVLAGG